MEFFNAVGGWVDWWVRPNTLDIMTAQGAVAVIIRLVLALICGGLIGIERERKRRPAGFRTHILICIGAAMATLTSQYIALELKMPTDLARLGAQVIAGMGFIGAGTIIVTKRRQVKGLTTAAGLWTAAIVGLCCGAGFIEGAIITTVIIIIVELLLVKFEYFVATREKTVILSVEYTENSKLGSIVDTLKQTGVYINDMEVSKVSKETGHFCAVFTLRIPKKKPRQAVMATLAKLDGVVAVEEL